MQGPQEGLLSSDERKAWREEHVICAICDAVIYGGKPSNDTSNDKQTTDS